MASCGHSGQTVIATTTSTIGTTTSSSSLTTSSSPSQAVATTSTTVVVTTTTATVSYYGRTDGLDGSPVACGGLFDSSALTAAHKTLPCGTRVQVCATNCVVVTVTDRGPYVPGREFDLSAGAFEAVFGDLSRGVGVVSYSVLLDG